MGKNDAQRTTVFMENARFSGILRGKGGFCTVLFGSNPPLPTKKSGFLCKKPAFFVKKTPKFTIFLVLPLTCPAKIPYALPLTYIRTYMEERRRENP